MAFAGKKVLITGGAGCLGLETAKRFHTEGATVILLDKDSKQLENAKKLFPDVTTVVADLLNWDATRAALETIGCVDHLINNAGVNVREDFLKVTPAAIDLIFGVNFKAIVNVSQAVAEAMIRSGNPGNIVNISSIASKAVLPKICIYSASKAAVNMLTKNMAQELAPFGIRVNAICPTYMVTPFTEEYIKKFPQTFDALMQRAPVSRFLEPSEAVDSIMFLSGSASSMINGTTIEIDGGYISTS